MGSARALPGRKIDFDGDFDFEEEITDVIVLKPPVERVSMPVSSVEQHKGGDGGKIVAD